MHVFRRATEPAVVWIAALVGTLAFLLTGPYSNFAPVGFLDSWYYTGYFLHFRYLVHTYGPTYYVARLPWILPGLAAFNFAPPEAASVILNLAIVSVSAVSLYWCVRWFYGPLAGVTAAAILVTNPYFMCTVCWDYPNGPSISYAFIALAFALRPNGARSVNSILTGIFLALSGLTHLGAASTILAVAAIPLWKQRHSARELLRESVFIAAGAASVILALCPVSQLLFGRWTYFYWQVYTSFHQVTPADFARRDGTGFGFLRASQRLFAPALLLLLGPLLIARPRKAPNVIILAWLSLLVCFALLTFSEFVVGIASLRLQYFSSFLLVPLFFFAGTTLGELIASPARALPTIIIALALPFSFSTWAWPQHPWWILFILGAIALALLLFRQPRLAALALAAILFLSSALDPSCAYAWDRPVPVSGRNLVAFQNLMTFDATLHSSLDPARRVRFWFDRDEPVVSFYDSAESLYLWLPVDFTRELPSWPETELHRQIPPNTTFVNLTLHPDRMPERSRLLAARGIHVANERRFQMQYRGNTVYIILQDVEPTHAG